VNGALAAVRSGISGGDGGLLKRRRRAAATDDIPAHVSAAASLACVNVLHIPAVNDRPDFLWRRGVLRLDVYSVWSGGRGRTWVSRGDLVWTGRLRHLSGRGRRGRNLLRTVAFAFTPRARRFMPLLAFPAGMRCRACAYLPERAASGHSTTAPQHCARWCADVGNLNCWMIFSVRFVLCRD